VRTFLHVVILGFIVRHAAYADVLKSDELQPFSDRVMARVSKGDLDGAFEAMKPYVVIPAAEFEALAVNTRAQRGIAGNRYGRVMGYECVERKAVGQSLIRITCIEKTEKHALPWRFFFYKGSDGWVLNSFNWSDNLTSLF
jgi:hypothetical protein